jgi:hypothetical protein
MLARKLQSASAARPIFVGAVTFSSNLTNIQTSSVNISSINIEADDLILVALSTDVGGAPTVTSAGYTSLYTMSSGVPSGGAFYKSAAGGETSIGFSWTSFASYLSGVVAVFRGFSYASVTTASGAFLAPNPPTSASGSIGDLIIACGHLDDDGVLMTAPSGFILCGASRSGTSFSASSSTAVAYRLATATTVNPGSFDGGGASDDWVASTIGCSPI